MYEDWLMLGLDPERFWRITPRLYMIETDAAMRRAARADELVLTAAWLAASLQRSKKIPPLKRLLGRDKGKPDAGMYLDSAKERLPKMTLSEWCARGRRTEAPE